MPPGAATSDGAAASAGQPPVIGEARWPMATAVVALVVLTVLLPRSLIVHPRWPVPLAEGLLLIAVIIGDPGKIDRRSRTERRYSAGPDAE